MKEFFNPYGIMVIGASANPEKIGHVVMESLLNSFKGKICPVNPRGGEVLGLKVYESIEKSPKCDLAVIALPAEKVPDAVESFGKHGGKAIIVISGGFRELGGRGSELEKEMVKRARKYGMRIIGPNCIGVLDTYSGVDTFFQPRYAMKRPGKGHVSIITQSGAVGIIALEWLAEKGVGIDKFISYGNKADVNEIDALEYLADEENTRVIGIYMEGIERGREFLRVLKEVTVKKPVVIIKAGTTAHGARAARSHTGSLATDAAVFRGALKQHGAIVADELEIFLENLNFLSLQELPDGGKVAIITNGAGPCVLLSDKIGESDKVFMARLSRDTIEGMEAELPPIVSLDNPIDLTGSAGPEWFDTAISHIENDRNADIMVVALTLQDEPVAANWEEFTRILSGRKKPIIVMTSGGEFTKRVSRELQRSGIPVIEYPDAVVRVIESALFSTEWLEIHR